MKLTTNLKQFAAQSPGIMQLFVMFEDYWKHYRSNNDKNLSLDFSMTKNDGTSVSFSEKEEKLNGAMKREILKLAGIADFADLPLERWITHPTLTWATFAIVGSLIDLIMPQTLIEDIGLYTAISTIGFGDSASFDVQPRDLFTVSRHGARQRTTELHKQFRGQRTLIPENRQMTVVVGMYKVLAGQESLAFFVSKAVRSIETQILRDSYDAFLVLMEALDATAVTGLRVSGYSQDEIARLAENVEAWNASSVILLGTKRALATILPGDANYRYSLDDDYVRMGYISNFLGYPVVALRQVADPATPWTSVIDNDNIYILSPGTDKLLKLVFEGGTIASTDNSFDNANLLQTSTMMKRWAVSAITSSVAGIIQI